MGHGIIVSMKNVIVTLLLATSMFGCAPSYTLPPTVDLNNLTLEEEQRLMEEHPEVFYSQGTWTPSVAQDDSTTARRVFLCTVLSLGSTECVRRVERRGHVTLCTDGSWSGSTGRGTCSHHGGMRR